MERNKIKELILEYRKRFVIPDNSLLFREVLKDNQFYLSSKEIIFITGTRSGSKSSLMKLIYTQLIKDTHIPLTNILYLNFEDEIFLEENDSNKKSYFFLDEIQHISGWGK